MPNSQRGVFASSDFAGYWRKLQKSIVDYVGSDVIGKVPNPAISSVSTSNKRLSLPTAGIVSAVVSSKTGFVEWHASRGGWVTYAQDFPETWSGCDLIVGASAGVPIKKGAVEAINIGTSIGISKERAIKQEKLKEAKVEGSAEGIGPETKKRKTGKSQKQLVLSEEKEVEQLLPIRTRVKTKVKSSFSQVPVRSSIHGSLGPSGCTRSKQKRLGDPVERERRARPLSFFSLLCCSLLLFSLQSNRKSDPKKGRSQSSGEDVVWFSFICAFMSFSFIHFSNVVYL